MGRYIRTPHLLANQVKVKIWLDATFEGALTHEERMHVYDLRMSLRPLGWLLLWRRVFTLCGVGLVGASARDVARAALDGRGSGIVENYKTVRLHSTAKTLFKTAHPTLRQTPGAHPDSQLDFKHAKAGSDPDPGDDTRRPHRSSANSKVQVHRMPWFECGPHTILRYCHEYNIQGRAHP